MSAPSAARVLIREARLSDLPAIVRIERESFSDPWSLRSFERLLRRQEALFEVAVRASADPRSLEEEVVGFCVGYVVVDEAELANVAVSAEARREGVGRRLVQHVIATVRNRGARELFLEVRISNSAARALYAELGFAEVGRRTRYYDRPVEDALILRLAIG